MAATPQSHTIPARRGRPARDWAAIDAALAELPDPRPYGALSDLATRLGVPASTIYARLQARRTPASPAGRTPPPRRPRAVPAPPASASGPARPAALLVPAAAPVRLDPTRCPAPGCPGVRTILADPRHMPTLPVGPTLVAQAGNLGMCDRTPPHYSWVGAAGMEVLDLEEDPV